MILKLAVTLLALTSAEADPPCACMANGKRFAQGEQTCINNTLLTCSMSGNISTWMTINQPCSTSKSS